ncbi:hypothetical protein VaNZ11_002713 [Volvox africanus]|uniref:Dol-P-Glc:Glc(2)Man(9)GlcNAc(2)-PP-Dol alpha-1,2-glucosyltransferase n=1 Tax=Volvox africanus TaxID=51714 RepID=A0ABQ5RSH3_9CHLO|nr:hypothetical protein VaNZ11_002713 [Volvox africanus]
MSWLVATFVAFQACTLLIVNKLVPDDYMDEIFHGPQARDYCRGAFASWHPKITTFPGIYVLGTLYGWLRWAAQALFSPLQVDAACTTTYLRSLNVLLSMVCLVVIKDIIVTYRKQWQAQIKAHVKGACAQRVEAPAHHVSVHDTDSAAAAGAAWEPQSLHPGSSAPVDHILHALLLALYPLHWFFSFLYYTDVASLLFLLLAQLQVAKRRHRLAALASSLAILCRQTNAVWAAFLLGQAALAEAELEWAPALRGAQQRQGDQRRIGNANRLLGKMQPKTSDSTAAAAGTKAAAAPAAELVTAARTEVGPIYELRVALTRLWRCRKTLAAKLWPLMLPPAGFAAFLVSNGGSVVLGDKEAHKAVRHGAQLLYFAGWTALMLWPELLTNAMASLRDTVRRRTLVSVVVAAVAAVAAAAAVGRMSTIVHPYMLADNRHYVFYLWRRLLGRGTNAKYILAPAYAAAWALLLAGLLRRVSVLWVAGFVACLVAQLLPAGLLELRYFTPGFFMVALHLEPPTRLQAAVMVSMYGAINLATMYMFLYRPFEFADGSVARFIW